MHNIVLSEDGFDELGKLFLGKGFEDRVVLLNKIFTAGLREVASSLATNCDAAPMDPRTSHSQG
jgi:hypothetical protein